MLPEAERLLRSELAKQHQNSPPDLHSANLTNFLGIVLEDQGHYPEAEACFRQAASEFETILGPQHPRLATTLANLGNLLVEEGHYQEAYRSIWRAIDIATPVLGDCHPAVAIMFGDLGNLFHRQKEIARALPNTRRQLACVEKQGTESVEVGRIHHNLASQYLDNGRYSLAQEHLDRASAILAKRLPPDHPDFLLVGNTRVALDYKHGRYKEARQLGLYSIEQMRRKLGPAHSSLAAMLANVAYADQKLQLYQKAAECFQQAIAFEEQVANPQNPYVAEWLRGYAAALRKTHRRPEAKKLESQAKAILANSMR